jgi:NADH:ubiquinone oxidoreductase subunit 5 (subunit L)/multisubunit Na+/H+ antiporter MnhA subunit
MVDHAFPWLWAVPLVPIGVAVVLFPSSARLPRPFVSGAAVLAWLVSLGAAAWAFSTELDLGGWAEIGTGRFAGARLLAWSFTGEAVLVGDPLTLLGALVVVLGAGLGLRGAVSAWGGGRRKAPSPLSGPQLLAILLLAGVLSLIFLSRTLSMAVGAAVIASLASWGLLLAVEPSRDEMDAANRWFLVHRIGDVAWLLGLALLLATWGTLDIGEIAQRMAEVDPWVRAESGPFRGFPARTLFLTTGALLVAGAASRLALLPLPMLYREVTGLPAPALAVVHQLAGFGAGLALLIRTLPIWQSAPGVPEVTALLAAFTALLAAFAALAARDVIAIDLHMGHALAALGAAAVALLSLPAATLWLVTAMVVPVVLLSTSGAVLEALQGRRDVMEMGGLWQRMRRSDRARAIATFALVGLPGMAGFLALERTLWEGADGPLRNTTVVIVLVLAGTVLSFAAFRALHLVFSGEKLRSEAPAVLVDLSRWQAILSTLAALAMVGLAPTLALPEELGRLTPVVGYQEPLARFLEPALRALFGPGEPLGPGLAPALGRAGFAADVRYGLMGIVAATGVLGFVLSALLFRKGPTPLFERIASVGALLWVRKAAETTLGLEILWTRGALAAIPVARAFNTLVLTLLLDGLITRFVALVGAFARGLLRLLHNGDAQRALFAAVVVIVVLFALWGGR